MRKAIALLAALVALPSFGAVDTTTISGKVLTPSGDPATAGKVTCELSQAASASDGSGVQRVATRVSATIGATGAVSIAIAPNDTLTPAGTYYTCKFTVTTPASASWVEKWSVASAPDPVDLGSVSRLDVAPGTTTGVYVVALATCSGACPNGGVCIDKDDASTFYCYAGSWTRQDMPPCSPDPPTGPCTDGRLCQATATGFAIYGCYASAWAAVTGGGGATVAVDGDGRYQLGLGRRRGHRLCGHRGRADHRDGAGEQGRPVDGHDGGLRRRRCHERRAGQGRDGGRDARPDDDLRLDADPKVERVGLGLRGRRHGGRRDGLDHPDSRRESGRHLVTAPREQGAATADLPGRAHEQRA